MIPTERPAVSDTLSETVSDTLSETVSDTVSDTVSLSFWSPQQPPRSRLDQAKTPTPPTPILAAIVEQGEEQISIAKTRDHAHAERAKQGGSAAGSAAYLLAGQASELERLLQRWGRCPA